MDLVIVDLVLAGVILALSIPVLFRRVVNANEMHIVQNSRKTISYGKDTEKGNCYYEFPRWVPLLGVTKVILPVSVFDLDLIDYEAYDKGRLPFIVDVKAFFRISDSNLAAQRVTSFTHLHNQLKAIVQGAIRSILASNDIEEILQGRSKFGNQFTDEVKDQLVHWGVQTVKNIELMDIRDTKDSEVIHQIMSKKKSHIEMESRQEVAKNSKLSQIAEIESQRSIELEKKNTLQLVGIREIEAQQLVSISREQMNQKISVEQQISKEKAMEIVKVEKVKSAEIEKETANINALKEANNINIAVDANLNKSIKEAEAIKVKGNAESEVQKAMQLVPVTAQLALAKEIGGNESYQSYLISIKKIEASQSIGMEQAKALNKAEIKIICNAGDPSTGLNSVMDLFTSNGGVKVGSMLESFVQTDTGKRIVDKIVGN